jgi:hypothetical protein
MRQLTRHISVLKSPSDFQHLVSEGLLPPMEKCQIRLCPCRNPDCQNPPDPMQALETTASMLRQPQPIQCRLLQLSFVCPGGRRTKDIYFLFQSKYHPQRQMPTTVERQDYRAVVVHQCHLEEGPLRLENQSPQSTVRSYTWNLTLSVYLHCRLQHTPQWH